MSHIIHLKLNQITELTHKDAVLRDAAQVYYDDQNVMNKCNPMKVMTAKVDAKQCYITSALDVINKSKQLGSIIDVNSVGGADFIIAYKLPSPPAYIWQWIKTIFVYLVCFFGATFTIMASSNGVDVADMSSKVSKPVMSYESGGFTVLEVSYFIGLAMGIIGFFNHFAVIKLNTDPAPLGVEMRLYGDNISKTLIANGSRKESGTDIT